MSEGEYPEHDKLRKIADESQALGEFIDVGIPQMGLVLCDARDENGRLWPTSKSVDSILSEYFGIDRYKLEAEKREMLEKIRSES